MSGSRSAFSGRDAGLLLLLALFWGNSFLFITLALEAIPPVWVVSGRLTVGALLLLAIVRARSLALPRERRLLAILAVIGAVGTGGGWLTQAWAQQQLDSGLVAVLNSTTPAATLLLAVLAGQERLHGQRVAGLVLAMAGTLVIIGGEVQAGGPALALAAATLATIGYGFATVLTRAEVTGRIRPLPAAATQLALAALLFNLVGLAAAGAPPAPDGLPVVSAAALLALGVFGTGLAFIIYFTLIERVGATNASMVTYLVPIVGLISGAVFRDERFGLNVLLGAAILIGGVWLAQREPDQPQSRLPEDRGLRAISRR